jgi:hypothetical protein
MQTYSKDRHLENQERSMRSICSIVQVSIRLASFVGTSPAADRRPAINIGQLTACPPKEEVAASAAVSAASDRSRELDNIQWVQEFNDFKGSSIYVQEFNSSS